MLTTRQATTALLAVAAGVMMMTPGAFAQSRFQTPDGHQTISPSEMPQQPSFNEESSRYDMNTAPKWRGTAVGGNDQPGAIVLPQGESSTVRVGPMEPISPWARAALAFWLLLMFGAMTVVAVALQISKSADSDEHGGHLINPDYREPIETRV